MKFLVDENLPARLAIWLSEQGHKAHHVLTVGLAGRSDGEIWRQALETGAVIVTRDSDFVAMANNDPTGWVVRLRIGNCSTTTLLSWMGPRLPALLRDIERGEQFIEVE